MKTNTFALLVLATALLPVTSAFADTADEAMNNIMQAGPVALPPSPPEPPATEAHTADAPIPAAAKTAAPTLLAELDTTKLEEKGYTLVPTPEQPKPYSELSYGERMARQCAGSDGYISFDCAESPAIALLNIADQNRTKSPATYWIVGALGMILGAILFVPALVLVLVTGGVKMIHDIVTES